MFFHLVIRTFPKKSRFYEEFCLPKYNGVESQQTFGGACRLHLHYRGIIQPKDQLESRSNYSKKLAQLSESIGNRREMEGCKSVPVGSPKG
jgi:hypothetical protein